MIFEHELIKIRISDLAYDKTNPNKMNDEQMNALREAMKRFGYLAPIIVDQNNMIADGEHRALVYKEFGLEEIQAYRVKFTDDIERRLLRQTMNKMRGEHDLALDAEEIAKIMDSQRLSDLSTLIATDENLLKRLVADFHPDSTFMSQGETLDGKNAGSLALRWGIPPFSVLDRRTQTWQLRRRQWLDFGIASEQGREEVVLYGTHINMRVSPRHDGKVDKNYKPTVSVFDPVIAEIMIRWFCVPEHAQILDPFCGGSVRGIVASFLGHDYTGVDLRQEQIDANYQQYEVLEKRMPEGHKRPTWLKGDSKNLDMLLDSNQFDFCLTSPPYFRIEHYSDLDEDLNNMDWEHFADTYSTIINKTTQYLKPKSFVAWNVGNARNPKNKFYVNQQDLTKRAFEECGYHLQNELVLIHPGYSLPFRVNNMFLPKRTIPKQHEFVLIFYNGTHDDIPPINENIVEIPTFEQDVGNIIQQTSEPQPEQIVLD